MRDRPAVSGATLILAAGALTAVAGLYAAMTGESGWGIPLRWALASTVAACIGRLIRHPRLIMVPLVWLGLLQAIFFVYAPWFMVASGLAPPHHIGFNARTAHYLGSISELLVIHSAALCLAASALVHPKTAPKPISFISAWSEWAFAFIGIFAAATYALAENGVLSTSLTDIAFPAMAACCVILLACRNGPFSPLFILTIGAASAAFALGTGIKLPLLLILACVLYWAAIRGRSRYLMMGGLVITAALAGYILLKFIFWPLANDRLQEFVSYKLLVRQAETTFCLSNLVDANWPEGQGETGLYFVYSLVPRAIWPEKPILSDGVRFTKLYCDLRGPADTHHAASVTIFGEPIEKAGLRGLLVAEAFAVLVLTGFSVFALGSGALGWALMATLMPWLVDIDQSFGLMVARAGKSAAVVLPLFLLAAYWTRRHR